MSALIVNICGPLKIHTAAFICMLVLSPCNSSGQVINEVLCSNRQTNADEDGDTSDWIELYNEHNYAIDVGGYWISDDLTWPEKWKLPPVQIQPGEHRIIWLSGKSKALHANFKLSTVEESVTLSGPDGAIIDTITLPVQYEDQSYGRIPNGSGEFVYLLTPSPGEGNVGPYSKSPLIVRDTKFSSDRGFYEEPFFLKLTTETDGAEIRYTLDGSTPAVGAGYVYTEPIYIGDTTIVRAAAYKDGYKPTNVDTQSYLFVNSIINQDNASVTKRGFPQRWGGIEADYEMDKDVIGGSDAYGGRYTAAIGAGLRALPVLSIGINVEDLFGILGIYSNPEGRGVRWERAASIELFNDNSGKGFQIDAGLRINGNASRSHTFSKKHSFRVHFRSAYGTSALQYKLFRNARSNSRIDTLVLRANAQDGWQAEATRGRATYIRDAFARESLIAMGSVASHHRFVHLYLNGVYWGVYEIVERPDHAFSAAYNGGDKSEWDAISDGEVSHGSMAAWATLLSQCRAGLESDVAYEAIQGRDVYGNDVGEKYLNTHSLVDYMIASIYIGNMDWPGRNWWACRRKSKAESTGFNFYVWDSEMSLGLRSDYQLNLADVTTGVAVPYAAARLNRRFTRLFGDKVHEHFVNGGVFYVNDGLRAWEESIPERNRPASRFATLAKEIEDAIVAESARWGDQHNIVAFTRDEHWSVERDVIRDSFLRLRSAEVLRQLIKASLYPTIEAPVFSQHGGVVPPDFPLSVKAVGNGVWYTLDASDPCSMDGGVAASAQYIHPSHGINIIGDGAPLKYHVPDGDNMGVSWTQPDYNDEEWHNGVAGLGFGEQYQEDPRLRTNVANLMHGVNGSIYIRLPFAVLDPKRISFMSLDVTFADGYIAYLNGVRIAERNAPVNAAWSSEASRVDGEVSTSYIDISAHRGALRHDSNVLAIHGLNAGADDGSFFIAPLLTGYSTNESVVIKKTCIVSARTQSQGEWSALNRARFTLDIPRTVIISEVMYNPSADNRGLWYDTDAYEFVELHNHSNSPVVLLDYALKGGIEFFFADSQVSVIRPGSHIIIAKDESAFRLHYKTPPGTIAGEYRGELGNDSDSVSLCTVDGQEIDAINYKDNWFVSTDGNGYSLVRHSAELGAPEDLWKASVSRGGSPGAPEPMSSSDRLQLLGDWNEDGKRNLIDAIRGINMIMRKEQDALPCDGVSIHEGGNQILLNVNGDDRVDLSDPLYLLLYLFNQEPGLSLEPGCIHITGCHGACN